MKLLQFSNYQCPACFAMYLGTISDDGNTITFKHAGIIAAQERCVAAKTEFTRLTSEYLVEIPEMAHA